MFPLKMGEEGEKKKEYLALNDSVITKWTQNQYFLVAKCIFLNRCLILFLKVAPFSLLSLHYQCADGQMR